MNYLIIKTSLESMTLQYNNIMYILYVNYKLYNILQYLTNLI